MTLVLSSGTYPEVLVFKQLQYQTWAIAEHFSSEQMAAKTIMIKGLFVTLGVNDTQHYNIAIMLSVAFYLLLCRMLLCNAEHH
jgi:hypothetical protein